MVSIWHHLRNLIGRLHSGRCDFVFEEGLQRSLQELAERERRPVNEMAAEMLSYGLAERLASETYLERWRTLSGREQQVVALICQGYSTRQIADLLVVSPETVKTHTRHGLQKFGLQDKTQLRQALVNWEFPAYPFGGLPG